MLIVYFGLYMSSKRINGKCKIEEDFAKVDI